MREEFPGYYPLTERETRELWETATFVVDANVLLEPFRGKHSAASRSFLVSALDSIKARLWMPHQAALEFVRRRKLIVEQTLKDNACLVNAFSKFETAFDGIKHNPVLPVAQIKELMASLKGIITRGPAEDVRSKFAEDSDEVARKIFRIFEGRVGKPYSREQKAKIYPALEDRIKHRVPPGFEDRNKGEEDSKFGDGLLWLQMIDYARADEKQPKPVIFVTGDRKEDWWAEKGSNTPHPDLIKEWQDKVGSPFYIYSLQDFLERVHPFWVSQLSGEEILAALKELRESGVGDDEDDELFWDADDNAKFWTGRDDEPFWKTKPRAIILKRLDPHDGMNCLLEIRSAGNLVEMAIDGMAYVRFALEEAEQFCVDLMFGLQVSTVHKSELRASGVWITLTAFQRYLELSIMDVDNLHHSAGMLDKEDAPYLADLIRRQIQKIRDSGCAPTCNEQLAIPAESRAFLNPVTNHHAV